MPSAPDCFTGLRLQSLQLDGWLNIAAISITYSSTMSCNMQANGYSGKNDHGRVKYGTFFVYES